MKLLMFTLITIGVTHRINCWAQLSDRQLQLANFTLIKVDKIVSTIKLYYGDNDRPVTAKLSSISSYLTRFGYVGHIKRLIASRIKMNHPNKTYVFGHHVNNPQLLLHDIKSTTQIIVTAIQMFQRFMRLKVTGSIDSRTLDMMNRPRCATKDLGEQIYSPTHMTLNTFSHIKSKLKKKLGLREKRHALAGSRWKIKNITYKITKYPTSFHNKRALIDDQIEKAFKFWSDVTPLTFTRLPSITPSKDVIIDIRFEKGEHGDGDPHDGVGKVLAHAYFPQYGGDAHFDDDEQWTIDSTQGSNVLITAVHELGHSLGLDHSDAPDSVMNPIYPPFKPDRKLTTDDTRAIQLLYGSRTETLDIPNLCINASIDAFYETKNNSIYVFKDKYFWKIKSDEMRLDSEYPKLISEEISGLIDKVDAVVQMPDSSIYLFQNEKCFQLRDLKIVEGFPKNIKDLFPSLPTHVNAALYLDGMIYAFKGKMFWEYDIINNTMQNENPKPIQSKWPGVPNDLNAVFGISYAIYFFKDQQFYRFNKLNHVYKLSVSNPPYPRKTALSWFGCH